MISSLFQRILNLIKEKNLSSEIVRGSIGSFGLKVSHLIFGFITGVILARLLGANEYGFYAYAIATISLLNIPTQLGMPQLLVRFVAKYQVEEEWSKLKGLLKWSNTVVSVISIVIMVLVMLFVSYKHGLSNDRGRQTLFWATFLIPLLSLGALRGAALRGMRYVVHGMAPEMILTKLFLIIFLIIGSFVIDSEINAIDTVILHIIAASIAFLIGAWWLWKKTPREVTTSEVKYALKEWLQIALPFLITGGMAIIINKIDIFMLGLLRDSSEVGIYDILVKISLFVPFSLTAINFVIAPYFSSFYSKLNLKKIQLLASYGVISATIISIPIVIVLIFFGSEMISTIFGNEYTEGYDSLVILVVGQFINVVSGSVGILLNMTNYERLVLKGMAFAALINILLNATLIPNYGMEGAAWSSLITFLLWNLVLNYFSIKKLKINPSVFHIFKLIK